MLHLIHSARVRQLAIVKFIGDMNNLQISLQTLQPWAYKPHEQF